MGNLQDYGFPFNSVASDRTYNASDWRDYFQALVEGGVVGDLGDELEVTQQASPDKSVLVGTGFVVINGAIREVSADITVNISDNTSGSTRVDRIVARLDYTDRLIEIDVIEGTPGAGAPALTQGASIHEIALAQVELANGFSTVTDAMITDEREYFRYRAKPAWYPEGDVPLDAWMYSNFRGQLTAGEITDIEANSSLMDIIADHYATQDEAEAGTDNIKHMTPLRVKQAIDENKGLDMSVTAVQGTSETSSETVVNVSGPGVFSGLATWQEDNASHGVSVTIDGVSVPTFVLGGGSNSNMCNVHGNIKFETNLTVTITGASSTSEVEYIVYYKLS